MDRFLRDVHPIRMTTGPDYAAATPRTILLADLNADGKPDLIVGTSPGVANHYYLNPGDGKFQPETAMTFGGDDNCRALFVADLNADTFLDIVVGTDGQRNKAYFGRWCHACCVL